MHCPGSSAFPLSGWREQDHPLSLLLFWSGFCFVLCLEDTKDLIRCFRSVSHDPVTVQDSTFHRKFFISELIFEKISAAILLLRWDCFCCNFKYFSLSEMKTILQDEKYRNMVFSGRTYISRHHFSGIFLESSNLQICFSSPNFIYFPMCFDLYT